MKRIILIIAIVLLVGITVWQVYQVRERRADIEAIARIKMRAEEPLTAASLLPADCAFFSTNLLLKEQYDIVRSSMALKRVLELPLVQVQLIQIRNLPQFQQTRELLETSPLARDSLEVAKDALSSEVFVCGDKSWVKVSAAFMAWINDIRLNNLKSAIKNGLQGKTESDDDESDEEGEAVETIRSLIKHRDGIFTPAMLVGFRLSGSEERLEAVLKEIAERINENPALPAKVKPVEINGNNYYTMVFTGDMVPGEALEDMRGKLEEKGLTPKEVSDLLEWVKTRKIVITAGFYNPYFIVSLGTDDAFLERLGGCEPLLRSPGFEPVEQFKDRRVASIGYVSKEMAALGQFDPGQLQEMVSALLEGLPDEKKPEGLSERLQKDLEEFSKDIEASLPEPSEIVSVSILNRGIESFTFSKSLQPGVDYTRVLTILKHAGGSPMLAIASSAASSVGEYEKFSHWSQVFYGYIRDYVVPNLGEKEKDEFERFQAVVLPALRTVDDATRKSLLPAIDAGQSLFIVDTGMKISKIWKEKVVETPLPVFEPAYALELKNAGQFKEAIKAYVRATEGLVNDVGALKEIIPGGEEEGAFSIADPTVTPLEEGKIFMYGLPPEVDPAIQPNLAVTEDLAVFSLSPGQTERMCKEGDFPRSDVITMDLPSGCIFQFRMEPLIDCARQWVDYFMLKGTPEEEADSQGTVLFKQHIEEVFKALGTFKGITWRTYMDGDYVVIHSWAEFQDSQGPAVGQPR